MCPENQEQSSSNSERQPKTDRDRRCDRDRLIVKALLLMDHQIYDIVCKKKPAEWANDDWKTIQAWLNRIPDQNAQTLCTNFVEQLQKPGNLWEDEEILTMRIFLNLPSFRNSFLKEIRRLQSHFNHELAEDCWQEFCGRQLQRQLQTYDPQRGSIHYWLKLAINSHSRNFYRDASKKSFDQSVNFNVDSIDEKFSDTVEPDIAFCQAFNKKTQTASIMDKLESEELKEARKKIYQKAHKQIYLSLSRNDQLIIDVYLDLKSETTINRQMESRDKGEQVAALMNEKGLLNTRGRPYTATGVRKIYSRYLDELERYIKDNGLRPKD